MGRLAESEFRNMKKSSEWVRQPGLDKKLDQLVEERGCTPAEVIAYDAAKALGIEPSGDFYKKVRDWKQRRAAEHDVPVMEVPPQVQAEFRETVDRFAAEAMSSFVRAVRGVGGDLNRVATLRIGDAERRADDAQAEVNGLLDHWTAAEAQRDAALARVTDLEKALADARRREEVAVVRLEERDALLKALRPEPRSKGSAITPSAPGANLASDGNDGDRQVGNMAIDASSVTADQAVADVEGPKQSTVGDADRPEGGQVEMPLGISDNAGQADVGGEDRD